MLQINNQINEEQINKNAINVALYLDSDLKKANSLKSR